MKRIAFFATLLVAFLQPVVAQRISVDCMDSLRLTFVTPEVRIDEADFATLILDGYMPSGTLGGPALPVLSRMIELPFCDSVQVGVNYFRSDTLALNVPLMPRQPSPSKSARHETVFVYDSAAYAPACTAHPVAWVEQLGVARDRNLALLHYSPVQVVEGGIVVCRVADITLKYAGADSLRTMSTYRLHHTPAFASARTVNSLLSKQIESPFPSPVRLTILASNRLECSALERFAAWKRQQGLLVDLIYVPNVTPAEQNADLLRGLYDNATPELPAPTYILLVGDNGQLPAFSSDLPANNYVHEYDYKLDEHVTDLYFSTWTNDMLPDCYQGRFSATDTATLREIVDKTLYYEQYLFDDDSYLGKAALVAGVDNIYYVDTNDNAYQCADPAVDYQALHYINANHGFSEVHLYKNNTSYAPLGVHVDGSSRPSSTASKLRDLYAQGLGWINYSAHGDWDEWTYPQFTTRQVANMNNKGKPSFMIGNCCLTNAFDNSTCFGEALLRRADKAGAVAYIGATNSSFWDEDFYWSIGVRNDVYNRMPSDYNSAHLGMYDHLFHTHGEPVWSYSTTAGRMMMSGLMSVYSVSGSDRWSQSMREYYAEIYELMGDPTLMPWLGTAAECSTHVNLYGSYFSIAAPAGAHVALVQADSATLTASAFAWQSGEAFFNMDTTGLYDHYISITAQGHKPLFIPFAEAQLGVSDVAEVPVSVWPNPARDQLSVSAEGLRTLQLVDATSRTVRVQQCGSDRVTMSLAGLPQGVYVLRVETARGMALKRIVVL